MFGKTILQPRLISFYGDEGIKYRYSKRDYFPQQWHPRLKDLKSKIEKETEGRFNCVLCNYYRDGRDSMGAHSDNEPELGPKPLIASLSLGASRKIVFQHKSTKQKFKLDLASGSLLLMFGDSQDKWTHEIPKITQQVGPRINLTFRQIHS